MSRHQFRSRDSIRDCGDSLSTSHNKQGSDRAAHSLLSTRPRPSAHGLYVEFLRRKPRVFHASGISRTYLCPFCGPDRLQIRAGSGSEPHRARSLKVGATRHAPCFRSGVPTSLRAGVASSEPYCRHSYFCPALYESLFFEFCCPFRVSRRNLFQHTFTRVSPR